jgi:hypothetical protein
MEKENLVREVKPEPLPQYFKLTQEQIDHLVWGLFDWLAHSDNKHRMWLFQALNAYFNRTERPEVIY